MTIKRFLLLSLLLSFFSCKNKEVSPLDEAIKKIEVAWSEKQLQDFANKPDSIALADIHFSYGMQFRNDIIRSPKDSTLLNYFQSKGVFHEDDMSGIVFSSLHRKLNNKQINLEEQFKKVHYEMAKIKGFENKNSIRALNYLKKYNEGDTVFVRRPINGENAVQYSYPEDSGWSHNDSLDLLIKGIITNKSEIRDSLDIILDLKVLSMNNEKVQVLMEKVNINDTIEVDLRLDIIEDNW